MPVRRWSMALLAILSTGPLLERRKTGGLSPRLGRSGFQPGKSSKEGSVRARATALADKGSVGYRAASHKEGRTRMRCIECGSEAVTERPERTAQGYRRFRCRACGKPFNERSGGVLNRTQSLPHLPSIRLSYAGE